jgi:hypothetical protein
VGTDRRKDDRRKASIPVAKNSRKAADRRKTPKPRSRKERRAVPDRRASAWNVLEGA